MDARAHANPKLIGGDIRPLCLAWLAELKFNEDANAVPLPSGLGQLSDAQRSLAAFLRVDADVLAAAAEMSPPAEPPQDRLAEFIAELPSAEKDQLLLAAARGERSNIGRDLLRRYRSLNKPPKQSGPAYTREDLLARADVLGAQREQAEQEKKARRSAERRATQHAAREKYLSELSPRKPAVWRDKERVLDSKLQKEYAAAVKKLEDLRDLAQREGALPEFRRKLELLRTEHARKHLFIRKLNAANLA
jgi:hypothetical protein